MPQTQKTIYYDPTSNRIIKIDSDVVRYSFFRADMVVKVGASTVYYKDDGVNRRICQIGKEKVEYSGDKISRIGKSNILYEAMTLSTQELDSLLASVDFWHKSEDVNTDKEADEKQSRITCSLL